MSGYKIFPSQVKLKQKTPEQSMFLGLCSDQQLSFFHLADFETLKKKKKKKKKRCLIPPGYTPVAGWNKKKISLNKSNIQS